MEFGTVNPISLAAAVAAAQEPSREWLVQQRELVQAVKAINATEAFGHGSELTFVLDRHSRRAIMRVVDRETGKVIRQLPPEHVLQMAEELKQKG